MIHLYLKVSEFKSLIFLDRLFHGYDICQLSNFNLLYNFQWLTFPTQSCLLLYCYSYFYLFIFFVVRIWDISLSLFLSFFFFLLFCKDLGHSPQFWKNLVLEQFKKSVSGFSVCVWLFFKCYIRSWRCFNI